MQAQAIESDLAGQDTVVLIQLVSKGRQDRNPELGERIA